MSENKLIIDGTEYELSVCGKSINEDKLPLITFNGKFYEGMAIPKQASKQTSIPREYEIVSFEEMDGTKYELRQPSYAHTLKWYPIVMCWSECVCYTTDELIKDNNFKINSVRRLSDSCLFSVGDEDNNYGKITGINFGRDNVLYFTCKKDGSTDYEVTIDQLQKVNPVLFTTEDGKIAYEKDAWIVYKVDEKLQILLFTSCDAAPTLHKKSKYFSTEDAAKKYVLENKPTLSLNEVLSCCTANNQWSVRFIDIDKLNQLVNSKL